MLISSIKSNPSVRQPSIPTTLAFKLGTVDTSIIVVSEMLWHLMTFRRKLFYVFSVYKSDPVMGALARHLGMVFFQRGNTVFD